MYRLLTKRERIIFYFTVSVIIFSVAFNFLVLPILKKNDALNREINLRRAKLKKYLRLLANKDYLQNEYNKFTSRVSLSGTDKDALVTTLSELENFAKEANIRLVDIRPQNLTGSDLTRKVLIDLRTEGAMEGYLKFIYNIENSLSLLSIEKFQLNAKVNTPLLEGVFSISQLSISE